MNIIVDGGKTTNALRVAIEHAKVSALVHMNSAQYYFDRAERWTYKDVDTINHHLNQTLKAIRFIKRALAKQPKGGSDLALPTKPKTK